MKKGKKFLCMLFSVIMLVSCMATNALAVETTTQDGLNAVIQTDKDIYAANEDIQIAVTVTNTNAFEVKNVNIENFLPDGLTLKSGSLKSDTVNLKPDETLTLSCVAVLEKSEEPTSSAPTPDDPGITSSAITPNESGTISSDTEANKSETTSSQLSASENPSSISSTPIVNSNNSPQTGDSFPYFISFSLLAISAIAIVAIVIAFKNERKTRKIISLILCCSISASSITAVGFIRASAEEVQYQSFGVDKIITVDGVEKALSVKINYSFPQNDSFEFTINQSDFTTIENKVDLTGRVNTSIQATSISYKVYSEIDDGDFDYNGSGIINGDSWEINQIRLKPGINKIVITVETPKKTINKSINVTYDFGEGYKLDENHVVITDSNNGYGYVDNVILLFFSTDSEQRKEEIINSIGGKVVGRISSWQYHVEIEPHDLEGLKKICSQLNQLDGVLFATYDTVSQVDEAFSMQRTDNSDIVIPDDPWEDFWGNKAEWDESNPDGLNWGLETIQAPSAWKYNDRFSKINIGIVEYGFNSSEDLSLNILNPEYNAGEEHGTHVAGIIGAEDNNCKGITGIVWNKKLLCSVSTEKTDSKNFEAIQLAIESGAKVVNLSLASKSLTSEQILESGARAAAYLLAWEENICNDFIIIQAAGNERRNATQAGLFNSITDESIDYLFASPGMQHYNKTDVYKHFMIVGGVEKTQTGYQLYTDFLGRGSNYGDTISISAPAVDIFSTLGNDKYGNADGTSMAAPIVTGVTALVWSVNPDFKPEEVKEIVCTSIKDMAKSNKFSNVDSRTYPIVNAKLAVEEAIRRTDVASISGTVIDAETGAPLEANISATSEDGMMAFATSNPETGDFSIQNLPAGKYNVVISKEGYRNYTFSPTLTDGMIFVLNGPVELEKGLAPTVVGYVSDKTTGEKLEGVTVNAYDQQGYGPWAAATTDATGKFTLTFQDEGAYILKFEKDGYISTTMPTFASEIEGDDELVPMQVTMEKGNDSGEDKPIIDSGTCGENLTWVLYEDGELVISGTGEMEDYPSSYSSPWKNKESYIKKVIIESSVESIGAYAFYGCFNLTDVVIPNTVRCINNSAFSNCSLSNINITNSIISIGSEAFSNNNLKQVYIPDSVTTIGNGAFSSCVNLEEICVDEHNLNFYSLNGVLFDKGQTTILQYPIGNKSQSYVIPDGVTTIGDYSFYNSHLKNITIPDSVIFINNYAFGNCIYLNNVIIPDNVKTIGEGAFSYTRSMTNIKIGNGVTTIGDAAFEGFAANHTGYTISIILPDSLISVGKGAFSWSKIGKITIPASVTIIDDFAFDHCDSLKDIIILNPNCIIINNSQISNTLGTQSIVYGYKGSTAEAYATKYGREFVALD